MEKTLKPCAEWFNGDASGVQLFLLMEELLHTWDDLIDKDKPVTDDQINAAFLIALALIPSNPAYQRIAAQAAPMWVMVVNAYRAANDMEKSGDAHGLEISHTLRYAAGHIIAAAMVACGRDSATRYMGDMWRAVVFERINDYKLEHTQ